MGKPFDIVCKRKHVEFRLPNKPEHLCFIDTDDFRHFIQGTKCWYIHQSKRDANATPYIRMGKVIEGRRVHEHLHREVLGLGDFEHGKGLVDHKNRNGLDNRRLNIRLTDSFANSINSSGYDNADAFTYKGFSASKRRDRENGCYQCYKNKKYIGGSKTLDGMKAKIDKYISKT